MDKLRGLKRFLDESNVEFIGQASGKCVSFSNNTTNVSDAIGTKTDAFSEAVD
jgi:hypothetical protein